MDSSHTFVVAAYGHSPYLEGCLQSLCDQSEKSEIIISTSTPFDGIDGVASRYGARLLIHSPSRGIGPDWNFALKSTRSSLITLAHQDDIYLPGFTAEKLALHRLHPDAALSFCGSRDIKPNGALRSSNGSQKIKNFLTMMAFLNANAIAGHLRRRVLLGFGNPILCPTVTFNSHITSGFKFREDMRTNMDWHAWLTLSEHAAISMTPKCLILRRTHSGSTTADCIADGTRSDEDIYMFRLIWPPAIATAIAAVYRLSYRWYQD
jgi:hypothetical protein